MIINGKISNALTSAVYSAKQNAMSIEDDDSRIKASGIFPEWKTGSHVVGEVYNAIGQTWECFQAYDNAVYPDITPGNSAWYTFNRPLHGKSPETAKPFVQPMGAHDMYKVGEYMVWTDGITYKCLTDTNFSPKEYPKAWEVNG